MIRIDHDPYEYFKDVLTRLPTQKASEIDQLLPHQWMPNRSAQGVFPVRLDLLTAAVGPFER